jgi:two-component system, NtrC family, sensor kinase
VVVPLLRHDEAIGTIAVARRELGGFTDDEIALLKTFADQAVIAIGNVRLFTELQQRNEALTQAHAQVSEALEQQTATSEILHVISSSPTDIQPVFDAIARSAMQLCDAQFSTVFRFDGKLLHFAAHCGWSPGGVDALRRAFPIMPHRGSAGGRAILSGAVEHIPDVHADPDYALAAVGEFLRSTVAVPMVREGAAIGTINVNRFEPGPFSDRQIELLRTFAAQAVIAIENVRLFTELQQRNEALTQAHAQVSEALEQQTATAEILRVISQSQTDVQPVFDTIVRNAARLCGASYGGVYRFDGTLVHSVAHAGYTPEQLVHWRRQWPRPVTAATAVCRAIRSRGVFRIADVERAAEAHESSSDALANVRERGVRSVVIVPMFRQQAIIGAISLTHRDVDAFSDAHVDLLKTFADQAVIAVENVRLFTELQTRTEELTRSVGQLTALGEVARAVSSTLDLDTVLSTIVSRAILLSGTDGGSVYEYNEATEEFSLRASRGLPEAYVGQVRDTRPRKGEGAVGRVAQTREPVQIADISDPAAYESRVRNTLLQIGLRALLAVPLIAEDRLVGALIVMRKRSGTFAAEEVALLQTFATQSALAIQNARLFREIEDKSRQLEVASQHKSEFLANMSHELRTPLNAIIGFSEVLGERLFGELNDKQEEYLKDIHASGQHLLSLINDILDLSKIEAGRMELELTDFDLPTAIDNALTLVRERAGRRGIALHQAADEGVGQTRGDERKIKQVLLNLLSNAIKFTPDGGRIAVRARPVDGSIEVSVSDTGVGIAPEDQEAIFEEFRQVGTAAKKVEGTGLGLALSRKFVELHGGRIEVQSQLGVGSTFTFTIPRIGT